MALFYFIRHGETLWNADNRLCGRSDVALSDAGRRQARRLAERLKSLPLAAIYTSPLKRTLDTARVIAEVTGREPVLEPSLIELDYGAWEGKTYAQIMEEDPEAYRVWDADPGRLAPPHGETGEQVLQRVTPFLGFLASRHSQGHVAVVTHKTICRLVICHILGMDPSEYRRRLAMENAAVNILQPWEQGWRLVLFNDTSHLADSHPEGPSLNEDF
jgi:broad specificity phosphatase PhoE